MSVANQESTTVPWKERKEWASPTVPSTLYSDLAMFWLFVAIAFSIVIGFFFLAKHLVDQGNYAPLYILSPFAFVALGLLVPGWTNFRQLLRFGRCKLELDPYPGSIGGHVGGVVDIPLKYSPDQFFKVALYCNQKAITNRSVRQDASTTVDTILKWSTEGFAFTEASRKGTRIKFRFDIPEDVPESSPPSANHIEWQVVLSADLAGTDFVQTFKIPVFQTRESAEELTEDSAKHPEADRFANLQAVSRMKIRMTQAGGVTLHYPTFHKQKLKGGGILTAVGLGTLFPGYQMLTESVYAVGVPFFLVGLVFLPFGIYLLFHNVKVECGSDGITTWLLLLGIPIRKRHIPRNDVETLWALGEWLMAQPKEGKSITLSQKFENCDVAKKALRQLSDITGYPAKGSKK